MSRTIVLYLTTLVLLMALDFLFLGILAKGFFVSEVGDMPGEVRAAPAVAVLSAARCSGSFATPPSI